MYDDIPLPDGFYLAVTAFLGLVLGSFATALAYRVPRDISILKKARSACTSCGRNLTALDLVPLFSWLALRGRCRGCGAKIGWQYPLIELATLSLCLAFYFRFGFQPPQIFFFFALAPLVAAIVAIDIEYKIIPDSLNLAMLGAGIGMLAGNALQSPDAVGFIVAKGGEGLAAAILYVAVSLGLRQAIMIWRKKDALGWGDVKFFAVAGFWLGLNPDSAAYLMLVAGLIGIFLAIVWQKIRKEAEFPFGPAILLAFIAMLLWQGPVFLLQ